MNDRALATLEFTTVREMLAERTGFAPGHELALTLEPATQLADAERLQDETAAARQLLRDVPSAGIGGAKDIRDALRRASLGGILDPDQLVAVAETTRAAEHLWADVRGRPALAARTRFARPPANVAAAIEHAISANAEVLDRASPALASARSALRSAQSRLQQRLDSLLRSPELVRVLQDPIVTQRGGRYVVPVKAEHRGAVKGIVHDQSASGATVFIEPLEILEANNQVREAELAERQAVQAVLDGLSRQVERTGEDLRTTLDALAALDVIIAKAVLADALQAERPALNDQGVIDLIGARHPLLVARGGEVVAIDVRLGSDFRALIITGPNTGGKTVTLKTLGLLVLMAQAGLQVPAERGTNVPVVPRVFADIGDEQSIAQSLSTFSSHLRNVVATLAGAQRGDLALLDEIGAGTDPDEGAALAMAVLETLLERGVLVAATTHYPELKAFALNTPGVANASVEFDAETLRPTYRVHVGLPGASNAFAIASRLGLERDVLARAETHLSELHHSLERTLREAERQRTELTASMEEARIAHEDAQRVLTESQREAARVRQEAYEDSRRARRETEELILQARRALRQAESARERASKRDLLTEAREALAAAEQSAQASTAEPAPAMPSTFEVGDRVIVEGTSEVATVMSVDARGQAEVAAGQLRLRVPVASLRPAPAGPVRVESTRATVTGGASNVPLQLDLRGARAEEALEELDRYLNDASLAGYDRVRVVHGKGTGALRAAVGEALARHPLVRGHEIAGRAEGGEGATIVTL
ncbi:MAG TPA: endonuclease MutS2 [Candidatus Limnocylindria bacterium]|nr:endonuclease MutS2 [Candidatus Limnocylindria bacterium]